MKKGFSLVELMVVIAIVALLAAVAVPSYRQYQQRAKMVEAMNMIQKQLDNWAEKNSLGQTISSTVTNPSPYVSSIVLSNSSVVATLNSANLTFLGSNLAVTYTPTTTNNVTTWGCSYAGSTNYSAYINNCSCPACPT